MQIHCSAACICFAVQKPSLHSSPTIESAAFVCPSPFPHTKAIFSVCMLARMSWKYIATAAVLVPALHFWQDFTKHKFNIRRSNKATATSMLPCCQLPFMHHSTSFAGAHKKCKPNCCTTLLNRCASRYTVLWQPPGMIGHTCSKQRVLPFCTTEKPTSRAAAQTHNA